MKETALRVFRETLAAINIQAAVERKLDCDGKSVRVEGRTIKLADFSEFVAIAIGKAAFPMAEALVNVLPSNCCPEGVLVAPAAPAHVLPRWITFIGGHPIPTEASFIAGRAILERLARCDERTLVFFLVSGGGSALVEQALDSSVSQQDFEKLNQVLVTCGAPIEEINVVRKHLSATKGGRLAAAAPRSMKITLGVSDVPQGYESALASGPTLPDPTTVADAHGVVARYHLLPALPASIREIFEKQRLRETPRNPIQHLHARISRCFLERTICSTPHTMPWKAKEYTASPTTRPTIGPSKKLPIICWVCWNRRNRATRSNAAQLFPVAK